MKLKSYNILFRVFSFLSDKTNGAPVFVKYKLLLGTMILGLISSSAKSSNRDIVCDTIPSRPIAAEVTCYKITVAPSRQQSDMIEVRGIVKDEQGELLIGTNIVIKNSKEGTLADLAGDFTIKVNPNDILVFSFIGYKKQEIPVSEIKGGKVVVTMEEDVIVMCYDVVVTRGPYNDDIYTRAPKNLSKLSYAEVDLAPVSPVGNVRDFENWVQSNVQYSEQMQKDKVQGQVILSFAIDKKGKLVDKKLIVKLSKEADEEVLRVLSLSEKWKPGMQNNKPVKTTMTITVYFKAQ